MYSYNEGTIMREACAFVCVLYAFYEGNDEPKKNTSQYFMASYSNMIIANTAPRP